MACIQHAANVLVVLFRPWSEYRVDLVKKQRRPVCLIADLADQVSRGNVDRLDGLGTKLAVTSSARVLPDAFSAKERQCGALPQSFHQVGVSNPQRMRDARFL